MTSEDARKLVSSLPGLTSLHLEHIVFPAGEGLGVAKILAQAPTLTSLTIDWCRQCYPDEGAPGVNNLHNYVTDEVLEILVELSALTHLDISSSYEVTDDGIISLGNLSTLTHLDISESGEESVTDDAMRALGRLPALTHLDVSRNEDITDVGFRALGSHPALTFLAASDVNDLTDDGLTTLCGLSALTHLQMSGAGLDNLTSDGIIKSLRNLSALTYLNISGLNVSNDGIKTLVGSWPALTHLDISGCCSLSLMIDEGMIRALMGSLPALTHLDISDAIVTDGGIRALIDALATTHTSITNLNILGSVSNDIAALEAIIAAYEQSTTLNSLCGLTQGDTHLNMTTGHHQNIILTSLHPEDTKIIAAELKKGVTTGSLLFLDLSGKPCPIPLP